MKLTANRLYLRSLTIDDATPSYVAWLNNPFVNQYLEIRHIEHSIESCKAFIQEMNASDSDHLFGIFRQTDDLHIGNIKLGSINHHYHRGELGLLIGEQSVWGQGFATEAIRSTSQFGFETLGLTRLEAGCYESNIGSLRAFLKAGFTVEGFLRQSVLCNGKRMGCFHLGLLAHELSHD